MYDEGAGVPKDHEEATRWYQRAAEQGHAVAHFNLGVLYANGLGAEQIAQAKRLANARKATSIKKASLKAYVFTFATNFREGV